MNTASDTVGSYTAFPSYPMQLSNLILLSSHTVCIMWGWKKSCDLFNDLLQAVGMRAAVLMIRFFSPVGSERQVLDVIYCLFIHFSLLLYQTKPPNAKEM